MSLGYECGPGVGGAHLQDDYISLYTTDNTMLANFINVSEMACAAHRDTLERLLKAGMAHTKRSRKVSTECNSMGWREERYERSQQFLFV